MPEIIPEKMAAQEEAEQRTIEERKRFDYYLSLRYDFDFCDVNYWLDTLFDQQKAVYKPQKAPSWNQVRKAAGVGLLENAKSFVSRNKELAEKKAKTRKRLQEVIDEENELERKRCSAYNAKVSDRLDAKLKRFKECSSDEVEEYFTFALNLDSFTLDGNEYVLEYKLLYESAKRQLVIDYRLPTIDEIPGEKEWKADKNNNVVPKKLKKADHLELYERILFDLALRSVGILFESDSNNVLDSVIFNGSCVYNDWQRTPTVLLSFLISKDQYSYERIRRMDCVSKAEIAKLKDVRYLDDIHLQKAPTALWETPPTKLVVPIKSSLG